MLCNEELTKADDFGAYEAAALAARDDLLVGLSGRTALLQF